MRTSGGLSVHSTRLVAASCARASPDRSGPTPAQGLNPLCLRDRHIIQVDHHAALVKVKIDRANMIYYYRNMTYALVAEVGVKSPVSNDPAQFLLSPGDFRICVGVQFLFAEV